MGLVSFWLFLPLQILLCIIMTVQDVIFRVLVTGIWIMVQSFRCI